MAFRPIRHKPVIPTTLVTVAFSVSITSPEALVSATRVVLGGRGMLDADVMARLNDGTGHADLGKCIEALMEESVAALGGATGADVGAIETFTEVVAAPTGPVQSNTGDPK
jgi:hypothetical protein